MMNYQNSRRSRPKKLELLWGNTSLTTNVLSEIQTEISQVMITLRYERNRMNGFTNERCVRFWISDHPKLYPDLFEDGINSLEKTISSFDTVWGIFRVLYLCDKKTVPPNTYFSLANRILTARTTLFTTEQIYKNCKVCIGSDFHILFFYKVY